MNKIRYILCGVMVLLCTCGLMFAGCGNSIDNLSIELTSRSFGEQSENGEYNLTLTKEQDDSDASWSATVSAEVIGLGGGMSSKIEWDWNSRFVSITTSDDGATATIKGVTSTSVPTQVTAYSVENRKVQAVINVTNIVKPHAITGKKYADGALGIPLGEPFSLDVGELFVFSPIDSTLPEYSLTVMATGLEGKTTFDSNEVVTLDGTVLGDARLTASPKDRSVYTEEEFQALCGQMDLKVYTPLSDDNFSLTRTSNNEKITSEDAEELTKITLIKNATNGENKVVLKVDSKSNITYNISSPNNIVYDENSNVRGALGVTYDERLGEFTLVGIEAMDDYQRVDIEFSVKNIANSLTLTKSFLVRIIDYPTAIMVNGVSGNDEVTLRVFDTYASGKGTELRLNIAPNSKFFSGITLKRAGDSVEDFTRAEKLLINGKKFSDYGDNGMALTSGATLYLTNNQGIGSFSLIAFASDAPNVKREIIISLEQSVDTMSISSTNCDENGDLVLEIDEYGGDSATTAYREFNVDVEPKNASFDTVVATSRNKSIVEVDVLNNQSGLIRLSAKGVGKTTICFVAQSGAILEKTVRVVSRFKAMTVSLDPNMSSTMYGNNTYQSVTLGNGETVKTLESAYIAKTGSGNGVYLENAFYPSSFIDSGSLVSINFISSDEDIASIRNTNANKYRNVLTTKRTGEVTFKVEVTYYRLKGSELEPETVDVGSFTITVFEQIKSISVNETSIQLLASIQNLGSGSTSTGSVYDDASTRKTLKVNVEPANASMEVSNASWTIVNSSKIVFKDSKDENVRKMTGESVTVSSLPLAGNDIKVSATVVVSITDFNGITFTKEVAVIANKIQQITDVYIKNYEASLKNNSLYFEIYKEDTFTLDVEIEPKTATNQNLEYIIFDAELTTDAEASNSQVVRVASSNGGLQYYRILPRSSTADYPDQYTCKNARLVYDETDQTYTIQPRQAGYAFVFIIPQDIASERIDKITTLTSQLRNETDVATIKRIPITIADGINVYYQLYTAEDVASIGSTEDGLTKNYYVMNTIDMSQYITYQMNANSNWVWSPIGNVTKPFSGTIQSMEYNGQSSAQNIVGWKLSRSFDKIADNTTDYRNYGIFGVVTGKISNVNFYLESYEMTQSISADSSSDILNNYNYGLVVGRLMTQKDDNGNITKSGQIQNVNVYCGKLVYTYSKNSTSSSTKVSANIGAIGLIDTNASVDNLSVSINNAEITSDDLIINFGGIAGQNAGSVGGTVTENTYSNFSSVVANESVTYATAKETKSKSTLGSAVGLNKGVITNMNASGTLRATTSATVVGGLVGQNSYGSIENVLSSSKIRTNSANAIQGGVVGLSVGGVINLAYYDIYTNTISGSSVSDSVGIEAQGFTGGIAGQIESTSISYSIVQAYDLGESVYNLINSGSGSSFGGLVGYAKNGEISQSFVRANLRSNGGVVAGILGQSSSSANSMTINNVYVRGNLTAESGGYAFVGNNSSNAVVISNSYVDLNNDSLTASQGNISASNVYILVGEESATETYDITREDFAGKYIGELFDSTNASYWSKDDSEINDGYPYLMYKGKAFVRQIPNKIIVSAKEFANTREDGTINTVLNYESKSSQKLIIRYQKDQNLYKLSDLFEMTTDLEGVAPENISINIWTNNTSIVQFSSATNFMTAQFKILSTGTVYIKVTSSQNLSAYDAVQLCIIDGFDSVSLVDEKNNNIFEKVDGDYYCLKIKHKGSTITFANYYIDGKIVNGVSGGIKFVTGLKTSNGTFVEAKDEEGELISNYKISTEDWAEGTWSDLNCLYHYAGSNDKLVFTAVGDDRSLYVTLIIPYFNVSFYALDDNKAIVSLESFKYELTGLSEISFETQLYYGVSNIMMGLANNTTIMSGDKLESCVTIINDAYDTTTALEDTIYYYIYDITDDTSELVIACDKIENKYLSSADMYINFTALSYDDVETVVIYYNIELSDNMRKTLKTNRIYEIVIGAIDENGEKIEKTVSLQWTFVPQEVKSVDIHHFSDAINSGMKLTQAGQEPTDTIVAGEFGLLRIQISPDYANFDSIEVTSSLLNGQPLAFDQRVLNVETDKTTKADIYTYISWQTGVVSITNGISLYRVSLPNGEFDGNFYVRTICLNNTPNGSQYVVTVAITQNGKRNEFTQTFTVYQTDTLSLEGENRYEKDGKVTYIVAKGTGYGSADNVLEQNLNPITVKVGSAYSQATVTTNGVGAVITNNGKYYLNTSGVDVGSEITVTLSATQKIDGYTYRATREIKYLVVDFYIKPLGNNDNFMPTTKRFAFIDGKKYDLELFAGVDTDTSQDGFSDEDLEKLSVITFDPSDVDVCKKIKQILNDINGKANTEYASEDLMYNGWLRRVIEADGTVVYVSLNPQNEDDNWIDNNYKFYRDTSGFKVEASGISSGNYLQYRLCYGYSGGVFALGEDNGCEPQISLMSDYINMEFYQITSQEHPHPIYTLNQFMSMEDDIDYILLNDLEITGNWTPLNVAVKSFNGNGYSIKFNVQSIVPSSDDETNYGLFGTIDEASVIKNLKIDISLQGLALNNDENEQTSLNFGALAGTNNGTVYNCVVYGLTDNRVAQTLQAQQPDSNSSTHNVAGLVAINAGGISNSRVEYVNITAGGNVAGLVVKNSGVIAGSYYTGGTIQNLAKTEAQGFATAGLVLENSTGGIINTSFVGGTYSTINADTKVVSLDDNRYEIRDATIISTITTAGFVYRNYGTVSDSYSAVKMFSNNMSGFAFRNEASGKISRCYSTSSYEFSSSGLYTSYPFIGAPSDNTTNNYNYNKTDGIVNCYYYDANFATTNREEATELQEEDFCGTNGNSAFKDFIFSRDGEAGSEFTGVWTFVNEDNLYFKHNRFKSKVISDDEAGYTNFGPKLVSASLIATPRMTLNNEQTKQNTTTGEIEYYYNIVYSSVFRLDTTGTNQKQDEKENYTYFNYDYTYDPLVVSNMEQFNNALTADGDNANEEQSSDGIILSDIRIVNHLEQSDLNSGTTLNSPSAMYAGILSGNGFTFKNVSLAINSSNVEYYGLIGKLMYKAKSSDESVNHIGTIKNFNVTISNINCSRVTYVGGLVGWADSANLYDIKVTNNQGRVVGNNIVGGIAGYVTGTSRIHTAYANVGVTANYRANTENIYNLDLVKAYGLSGSVKNVDVKTLGYAGGLFGFVDITQFDASNPSASDESEARVYNISGDSNVSIVGKIVGGLIGGVGLYTVVYKADKTVTTGALLRGYTFAGGVVGQNSGYLKYANIKYSDDDQALFDKASTGATVDVNMNLFEAESSPLAVGGIVGLNIGASNISWGGGTIQLSSCKVAVRDSTASNAGGIAGAVFGGDIRACFATGSVLANKRAYVGGIVGYLGDFSSNGILKDMASPFGNVTKSIGTTIDYVVAMNNYLASDYSYYETLSTNEKNSIEGAIGGIVGYAYKSSLLYSTHTVKSNDDDEYAYLEHPTNYFVSQILGQTTTSLNPVTSGKFINLYETNKSTGEIEINKAVGRYGNEDSINLGKGLTRPYMLANPDEIFSGWDEYSLDTESGMPSIVEKDMPDTIEVDEIADFTIMYWHPEKTYILTKDIDFQDTTVTDEKRILSPFFPIGAESAPFTGKFTSKAITDSEGNTRLPYIKNIYIINSSSSSVGFFGATNGAEISNIVLKDIHYSTAINESSRSNVGGLAGIVVNSTITNVSILIEDETNSGIFTNANNVGGMFGVIKTIGKNGNNVIDSCYVENNLVLTDNYYSIEASLDEATLGGFAGIIEGNSTISGAMATGKMTVEYTEITEEMKNQGYESFAHFVGGFVGQISGNVRESACVTTVDMTLNNVLSDTKAGGFVGVISNTTLRKIDSHAKITVNMAGITDDALLQVGGLVGDAQAGSAITGFVVATDIILDGEYDVTSNSKHYVAGIVAKMGVSKSSVQSGYSVASIINNTMLTNVDMGFGELSDSDKTGTSQGNDTTRSILVDRFYALTASDIAGVGKDSVAVKGGGNMTSGGSSVTEDLFIRGYKNSQGKYDDSSYYRIDYRMNNTTTKKDTSNDYFNKLYDELYALGSGKYKTAPILIADEGEFSKIDKKVSSADAESEASTPEYLYYLQTKEISVTKLYGDSQIKEFYGSYNGGGLRINLPLHFDTNTTVNTENCGLFEQIYSLDTRPSVLAGVVIDRVNVYAKLETSVQNFGVLAGKVTENVYISHCYVAGELNLQIAGSTNIGGLVGNSGAWYIGCATNLVANLYGDGEYKYGALVGKVGTQVQNYMLTDTYTAGKINNFGANACVAGIIADCSESNLYANNAYTMTEINNSQSTATTANIVCNLGGKAFNSNGIRYDTNNTVNSNPIDRNWETYTYNRENDFGGSFVTYENRNYGLPTLVWLYNIIGNTGSGVESSPYLINSATQFEWMLKNATSEMYFALDSDIDFSRINLGYEALDFAGHLNGQYHYINNVSKTIFETISGSVIKLGLNCATTMTGGAVLANNVDATGQVSEIYLTSTNSSVKVINGGTISNSITNGASFGGTPENCYRVGYIDNDDYLALDHTIWTYNGKVYTLAGFIEDCADKVNFDGLTIDSNATIIITVNTKQQLYNAIYYASLVANDVIINVQDFETLDLDGLRLEVPSNVEKITGISTIKNGVLTSGSAGKFIATNLVISSCSLISDGERAVFGETSSNYTNITITNSKIYTTRSGGMLFDKIENAINLTMIDSYVFIDSSASGFVDLVANESTSEANGYEVTIQNVKICDGKVRSIVYNNGANGNITIDNLSNQSVDKVINDNNATTTIDLGDGQELTEPIIETNGEGGTIIVTGSNAQIKSNIVTTNKGTIKVELTNSTISSKLIETNEGTLEVTLSDSGNVINVGDSALVDNNTGTVTLTLSNATISSAIVNKNSGTMTLNLENTSVSSAIVNENSGTVTLSMTCGNLSANVITTNNKKLTATLDGVTTSANLVVTHGANATMAINLNGNNTINTSLVDTAGSGITFVLKGADTINAPLVKTADSDISFELNGATVKSAVVTTNNATLTITATNNSKINNFVTTNEGTIEATITGGTVSQIVDTNINQLTAIISDAKVDGLVGTHSGTITLTSTNSTIKQVATTNSGTVTATEISGETVEGLVGTNEATGTVNAIISDATIKQIVDTNSGKIENTTVTNSTINGFIGTNSGEISNLTITGGTVSQLVGTNTNQLNATISGANVSGVIGENKGDATITIKSANGSTPTISGLITTNSGSANATITSCKVTNTLITTNSGTAEITLNGGTVSDKPLIGTNNKTAEITISGGQVKSALIDENAVGATATIEIKDNASVSSALINTNNGTANINNNGVQVTNALVGTNSTNGVVYYNGAEVDGSELITQNEGKLYINNAEYVQPPETPTEPPTDGNREGA